MDGRHLSPWFRLFAAVGALLVAGSAVLTTRTDARDTDDLVARARELGVTGRKLAEIREDVRREPDPSERRLALARALFRLSSQYRESSVELRIGRLEAIEGLAKEALTGLSASWEAANLLGASRFESRKLRRDTRLFSAAAEWELPLLASVARAAGSPLVERFLAAAYLEIWPAMAESRRSQATETLRRSFTDRRFSLLRLHDWIRVAGSYERAEEILPQDSATAERLADHAIRAVQVTAAIHYHGLARERRWNELSWTLGQALGSSEPHRSLQLTTVLEQAPLGLDFAPLVGRAAEERSPFVFGLSLHAAATRWLAWAEPLCLVGDCPLSPRALERLVAGAGGGSGSSRTAFAALVADKTALADQLARRANAAASAEWVPFGLLVAKRRLAAGDRTGALDQLRRLHQSARTRPVFARLVRDAGGSAQELGPSGYDPLSRETWSAGDWRGSDPADELEIGITRSASAIRFTFQRGTWTSFLLQVEVDGKLGPPVFVDQRIYHAVVPVELAPGIHLLRLHAPKGAMVPIASARLE